ncbi:MAG TPA: ABC transporter ATP-binding protein [Acidimicrobiales bacterium]|nr:ABC transporter ATP-binding protein [Acidimicrobiales bacterium]
MPAVEVSQLVVRYGSTSAVDGVSFSAASGRVLALLGPNGAGKTTTVETLEGYRRPSAGAVRVLGLDPIADRRALMPRIGVMLQAGGVYPSMRPLEVVRLFASYFAAAEEPGALIERVGLSDRAGVPWRRLSGGEQQRLSLALALVGRPEVAFLDEPTAGIDPQGRELVRSVVRELRDRGACVVITTHDLDDAEKVADDVVIIDKGRVVASGTPASLMTTGDDVRFGAAAGLDVVGLAEHLGATVEEGPPGEYTVRAASSPGLVAAITAWLAAHDLALLDLRAGRQTLEDVFLRLTSDGGKP